MTARLLVEWDDMRAAASATAHATGNRPRYRLIADGVDRYLERLEHGRLGEPRWTPVGSYKSTDAVDSRSGERMLALLGQLAEASPTIREREHCFDSFRAGMAALSGDVNSAAPRTVVDAFAEWWNAQGWVK